MANARRSRSEPARQERHVRRSVATRPTSERRWLRDGSERMTQRDAGSNAWRTRAACSTGKWSFPTRAAARKFSAKARGSGRGNMRPYVCDECGFWHIGHTPRAVIRGEVSRDDWYSARRLRTLAENTHDVRGSGRQDGLQDREPEQRPIDPCALADRRVDDKSHGDEKVDAEILKEGSERAVLRVDLHGNGFMLSGGHGRANLS